MLTPDEADHIVDNLFASPSKWLFSRNGNRCRKWRRKFVTVFQNDKGWTWSIQKGSQQTHKTVKFSSITFQTEEEAMLDVYQTLTRDEGKNE